MWKSPNLQSVITSSYYKLTKSTKHAVHSYNILRTTFFESSVKMIAYLIIAVVLPAFTLSLEIIPCNLKRY